MTEDDRRVAELREQLRALGYLDVRVDRYVLGAGAARPVGLALGAALRIGLLAGVLLGPAATIGLRVRVPGLVTSGADALILALYFAALFGVAAAAAAIVATLAGRAIARRLTRAADFSRRAAGVASTAGVLIGGAMLVYLTLWWRTASGLADAASLVSTAAALVVAVAMSVLVGYAVRLTILALAATLGEPHAPVPNRRTAIAGTMAPIAAVALAGSAVLLMATPGTPAPPAPPPLTVISTGQRLVVLAIDGVDVAVLDRLRAAGELPTLAQLVASASATMTSDADRDPARTWTTIATAQPPERHGVRALESREVAGIEGRFRVGGSSTWTTATDPLRLTRPTIASGDERLIPAFWEVAARAGLRTAVVHWWATWPAPPDLGVVLSDRAILRLERGGPQDAEIAPPALYDALARTWPARRADAGRRARDANLAPPGATGDLAAALMRSAELDATIAALAADPAVGALDLLVVYLPGLDIATHTLFPGETGGALDPAAAAERVAALERYYRFVDRLIAATPAFLPDPSRTVVVITQPGRTTRPGPGLLAIAGAPAATLGERPATSVTSVGPTVLLSLGVPIARDLASAPAIALFAATFLSAHPPTEVATYGSRHAPNRRGAGQPLNQEMIERMRSLGYLR